MSTTPEEAAALLGLVEQEDGKPQAKPTGEKAELSVSTSEAEALLGFGQANPESQGWEKFKQGASKMGELFTVESMLDRVTPDMVKDYQAGGVEGVIRGNAERSWVPGSDIVARTLLGDDIEKVIDEEISAADAINAVGEALPTMQVAPGIDMPILSDVQTGLAKAAVRDVVRDNVFDGFENDPTKWSAAQKAAVEAFERDTGKRWLGPKELAALRTKAPGEYRKARNRQQQAIISWGEGVWEAGQGLAHLAAGQAGAMLKGEGTKHALTTAGTIGGTMMEDWAQLVDDPEMRAIEDPFGTTMDLASAPGLGMITRATGAGKALAKGASVSDAAAAGKAARLEALSQPVLRPAFGLAKEAALKTPYDLGVNALKSTTQGFSEGRGRAAQFVESRVQAIPSATRLERALFDTLPDGVEGLLDASVAARQRRAGNIERAEDAVSGLKDSDTLEKLFGESAQLDDAAVLHVLNTDVAIKNKLFELRAEASLSELSPRKAALMDELNKVQTIDDVARFAADEGKLGLLDRDLRMLLDTQKYMDEVVRAAESGDDLALASALRNARGTVDDIKARITETSQRIDASRQRQFERIDAESLGRVRKALADEADALRRAELPQVERIRKANEAARAKRQSVSAKLKKQATNLGEFLVRQRNKADRLVEKTDDARHAVETLREQLTDLEAKRAARPARSVGTGGVNNSGARKGLNSHRARYKKMMQEAIREGKPDLAKKIELDMAKHEAKILGSEAKSGGRFTKAEAKLYDSLERKLREKSARLSELELKSSLVEDKLAKAQRVVDNWEKIEASEMALVKRQTEDMIADAAAKTEDAKLRARQRRKKVEDIEAEHVIKRKEAVREMANKQKAKKIGDLEARLAALENLDGNRKFTFADREAIKGAMLRDSNKAAEAMLASSNVRRLLDDPEMLKANGAWLELDGKVLGTAQAAAHVLAELNAGRTVTEIFDALAVKGDDAKAVAVLDEAREALRLSSEFDYGLMQHGVVSPQRFAANLGRNLLTVTNPRHAEDFTAARIAESPSIALLERSNLLSQLELIRDVSRLPGTVFDNTGYAIKGNGFDSAGVPKYKRQNIRGEELDVGKLPTPEGNIAMVRVPKTQMSTADLRFNKYGDMAGQWVTRDTFDGLQKFVGYRGDFLSKWGGFVKRIKVVDNLSSLVNMNLGNLASMAWDNIPPQQLGRALFWMNGKGSEVDKMFTQKMRYEGIYEGASSHHLTGKAEAQKLADLNMQVALREAQSGHAREIGRIVEEMSDGAAKFQGFGGAVRHTWRITDQAFRLATSRTLFERGAKRRGYDISTPDGMRRALEDVGLVDEAKRNTLRDTLDYGQVPVGPRIGNRGIYEWAADTGIAPFIIYPLKAGGLWAQRFADAPAKVRAMELAGEAAWQQTPEYEREKQLAAQMPWEVGAHAFVGDTSVSLTPLNPVAFLPVEMYQGMQSMGSGSAPVPMLAKPLLEAFSGKTEFGQELWHKDDPGSAKAYAAFMHLMMEYAVSPSTQRVLPHRHYNAEKEGLLDRAMGKDPLVNKWTREPVPLEAMVGRLFLNFDVSSGDRGKERLAAVGRTYMRDMEKAINQLGRDGNMQAFERNSRRADVRMAKEAGEVVSSLSNR